MLRNHGFSFNVDDPLELMVKLMKIRILKVHNFVFVDFETQVFICFLILISMKFCHRIINKKEVWTCSSTNESWLNNKTEEVWHLFFCALILLLLMILRLPVFAIAMLILKNDGFQYLLWMLVLTYGCFMLTYLLWMLMLIPVRDYC